MRVEQEPAWVLHTRPFRDTSLLVEILSRHHGRVGLVAKGVRGRKSKRVDLQPFRPLLISWLRKGDLGTLTSLEAQSALAGRLSANATMAAWYVNELLLTLIARDMPEETLFEHYEVLLMQLHSEDRDHAIPLRYFEKQLLDALGVGLPLDCTVESSEKLLADRYYIFDPVQGAKRCSPNEAGCYSGRLLCALNDHCLTADQEPEARRLLRSALALQLGGKTLKTPMIARSLNKISQQP